MTGFRHAVFGTLLKRVGSHPARLVSAEARPNRQPDPCAEDPWPRVASFGPALRTPGNQGSRRDCQPAQPGPGKPDIAATASLAAIRCRRGRAPVCAARLAAGSRTPDRTVRPINWKAALSPINQQDVLSPAELLRPRFYCQLDYVPLSKGAGSTELIPATLREGPR